MKHIYILFFCVFLGSFLFAQTPVRGIYLSSNEDILLDGNTLYISEAGEKRVIKIDVSAANPTITEVVTGLDDPEQLLLVGNDLYIVERRAGNIVKADISGDLPITTTTEVVNGLSVPEGILLVDDDLYIVERRAGNVVKADISGDLPITATTEVANGLSDPYDLALRGNDLYISSNVGNKISKVDIMATLPTTATQVVAVNRPTILLYSGNYLYMHISESGVDTKISRIDLTNPVPTLSDVVTGLDSVRGMAIDDASQTLYYSDFSAGVIMKFDLGTLSSLQKHGIVPALALLPNPTTETVAVLGLQQPESYRIYDLTGAMVLEGVVDPNNKIAIKSLESGIYLFALDTQTLKLIKE